MNARLLVKTLRNVTLVPSAAVQHNGTARFRVCRPAEQHGGRAADHDVDQQRPGHGGAGTEPGRQRWPPADSIVWRTASRSPSAAAEHPARRQEQAASGNAAPMNPSRPFILRPVATALLMAALFLAGGVAYFQLPVSALPEVDYPTIQVLTFYPGASPDVVASAVTAPLERQFGQVAGLSQMTSTSAGGVSVIVMQFQLSLNIDVAEQEVQAAINAAQSYLPANLPTPPVYSKSNPADAPVLTLALTSNEMPLSQVEDLADTRLAPKISQISGVGLVSISGGQKPAVRIQANPTALASYGINLEDLRNALTGNSLNSAKGNFDGPSQDYTINANDQLTTSGDYKSVVVAYRNGAPVMLTDVARVVDGVENSKLAAWVNYTPAVILNIQRQPGANTIQVVDSIEKLLPQLETTLPESGPCADRDGPHHRDSRVGERRRVRTDADHRAGGDGDFPVPAQPLGHHHSQHRGAAFAGGHVRRDVSGGLQPEQPHHDGADDLHRLRGGRRHRDDREHLALHRGGRESAAGGAEGRRADRLHHSFFDGVADRGADSAAIHGRYRGTPVPPVRGDAGRDHRALGVRFADADAHDVRAAAALHAARKTGPLLSRLRAGIRKDHRVLWAHSEVCAALPDHHAAGCGRRPWC